MLDIRAEGRKLGTLPMIPLAAMAVFLVTVVLAAVAGRTLVGALDDPARTVQGFTPIGEGFQAVYFGQAGMVVLGVLAVGGEFASGGLRTSLLAVPSRGRFLMVKALVVALLAGTVALVTVPSAFIATQIGLGEHGLDGAEFPTVDVVAPMAGAILYWTLLALLAAGATIWARNTVTPLVVLVSLVLALSHFLSMATDLADLSPDRAGSLLFMADHESALGLSAFQGAMVMVAWVVAVWLAATERFVRRDA